MSAQWYYQVMGEVLGPYSPDEMRDLASKGYITLDSLLCKGESGKWISASRVSGLFPSGDHTNQHVTYYAAPAPPPLIKTPPASAENEAVISQTLGIASFAQHSDAVMEQQHVPSLNATATREAELQRRKPTRWLPYLLIPGFLAGMYVLFLLNQVVGNQATPGFSNVELLPDFRNGELRRTLTKCESHGVVEADVYYESSFSTDVVVFDLGDDSSPEARRIDPVHLFLQFCSRIDLMSVNRVVLARNGRPVFFLRSSDLRPLANSYEGGGRVWAFNHLPENVRTMNGERVYGEWTGGWLGVMQKQAEDLNDFIRTWTGV